MQPAFELATILNLHWERANEQLSLNSWQWRTLHAIRRCRTAALGGHIDQCDSCGHLRISYNSCRNRHCPKCQGQQREAWMAARQEELLPVPYYHVVFTLPEAINQLALHKPAVVYGLLFSTVWSTIQSFASDPKHLGAQTGMISILHTWGQTLTLHPHLHCIVPGGGITSTGHWKSTRCKGKFLYPVKALSAVFRARYAAALRKAFPEQPPEFFNQLFATPWVVYAKRPFGGPDQVIEYLGRYTHKIAISNHRITAVNDQTVQFTYKDYRQAGTKKEMCLSAVEFIRRFALHILPKGFVRIRHYGMLSNAVKQTSLPTIREQLTPKQNRNKKEQPTAELSVPIEASCPCCKKGRMQHVMDFDHRGPPIAILNQVTSNVKTTL
ncbi:IS91 family transposase [Flavihumibacter stibioxidans]|uniref:Transposase n=1 Tax=Flavihumibacter stibioxidans TaxID=1834163 RepID=A0ABR7M6S7_9BACT|nr:transposase [Flavihumibacter stibioxidans]MBC6490694.1 transposase [Flavihumibacter stibioxidans]MBC6490710.1 transposase [Flavihumibacter stibioxidans]MBC6491548.1 transposase [Flavihumibacter stibioxidans]MBC6491550.1 transposase [Flavihumibacter stibioxidans]